jgi:tRNA pseudouridine55 synthase
MSDLSSSNIFINIDKPIGYSSAKVVALVKKITKAKKVGHTGTLDPFASGVLPIALNKATKACQYVVDANKKYYFKITWGEFRDTDDIEGKVTETSTARPTTNQINAAIPNFIGKISQTPSNFSAIKINGHKAYELARKNIDFEMKARQVKILSLKLINNNSEYAEFEVKCSKGTYIRTLGRDLSKLIGVCGYLTILKRLEVGKFSLNKTISLDKLKNIVNYRFNSHNFDDSLFSLSQILDFMTEIKLDDFASLKFKNGQFITINEFFDYKSKSQFFSNDTLLNVKDSENILRVINKGELIGLAYLKNGELRPINVF